LAGWPASRDGYRIGLLADSHLRDDESVSLTREALEFLAGENPDVIAYAGDLIPWWRPDIVDLIDRAFAPLQGYEGTVLAVPGNHDYYGGDAADLEPIYARHGVQMLFNESISVDGVNWVGVDSAAAGYADPYFAIRQCDPSDPTIVLWHEPDMVDHLPRGPELMLSGHSHGGQFTTPWGWAPMTSRLGSKYVRGFYPGAPVPIYVSRGLGTTGPPARLFCRAEATVLTLRPTTIGG
jgi:predicted MPP superfamily phosphohydrolase